MSWTEYLGLNSFLVIRRCASPAVTSSVSIEKQVSRHWKATAFYGKLDRAVRAISRDAR